MIIIINIKVIIIYITMRNFFIALMMRDGKGGTNRVRPCLKRGKECQEAAKSVSTVPSIR